MLERKTKHILATALFALILSSGVLAKSKVPKGISPKGSDKGTPCEGVDQITKSYGSWASTTDYPERALAYGREGDVTFKVLIGLEGRVKSCWIVKSSGYYDLDYAACQGIIARAKFSPAKDASGIPIEACFVNRVAFRIPKEPSSEPPK